MKKLISECYSFVSRYEFAPGRGQIHAHLLGIPRDRTLHVTLHETLKDAGSKATRADIVGQWAADAFGLTASVEEGFDSLNVDETNTPVRIRFTDLEDDAKAITADKQQLLKAVQIHDCSQFCMKQTRDDW